MFKSILNLLLAILFCFTSQAALGQVADFTASDTAGCLPKIISFTNTSSGSPTGYSWNLGNGSPLQTSRDVTASYTAAGVYTVTLITFYGTGSSTKTLQIHIYDAPTVSFNVSDTAVCPGAPITFTSTSVPNSWGTMTNSWNFGDGGSSSSYTASYSYPLPGYYNVTLFATNAPGCTGSLTKNKLIHVFDNSVLNFSATPTGFCKTPQNVTFLNTTTGINPLTYTWRFGDGGISSATNPTHTYTTSGNYNVTLLVKNGKGCLDSVVASSYINAGSLSASFTNTVNVCTKSVISFNNTSSTHVSCQWYFGDGGSATDESPVYAYGAPGIYTVKLVVFDGTCYDSVTHNVNVLPLPSGSFSSSPIHPCFDPTHAPPGPSVTYLASAPGGSIINWTFPDGSTGSGSPYTKIFAPSFGTIGSVSMTITSGSTGCQNTFSRTDSVLDLNLNPISDVTNGCAPLTCNFDVQAYSIAFDYFTSSIDVIMPYPYSLTSYDWDFRDGSPHSFAPKPMHVFSSPGVYNVKVTVRTVDGCIDSNTIAIAIGKKPNPTFTITPTHICAGKSVSLTCTSLDTIDMYTWDYGDGKVDVSPALPKTTHTYTVPGVFDVNMMVERYGCKSAFAVHKDTVDSPSAVIFYKYDCIPSNGISFTDTSLGDDTHLWQFGDGSTSTLHFIDHPYPSLALYTVTLTTFNNKSGCRDTSRTSIDLRRPNMAFTVTSTQLCRDRLDSFNALVSGPGSPPTLFKWYVDGAGKDSTGAGFFRPTFSTIGLHSITLIVQDTHTCFDTLTKPNYVLVAKPTDNFSMTPTTICGPATVNFTDASTDVPGTAIVNYSWTFGDGAVNTNGGATPNHLYSNPGTYTVQSIVTDNLGCKDTLNHPVKVTVYRPLLSYIASTTNLCAYRTVHFNNTSTLASGYLWVFGDGATSTVAAPDHIYTTSGSYTVKLIGFESHGCSDTLVRTNYITINPSPRASFVMDDSFAVCPPLNVHFTNLSTGFASNTWAFGDGGSSFATNPAEPYTAPGLYTVRLAVKSSNGCTDTAYGHVNIFGYKGAFKYTPLTGCGPLGVHFNASLSTVAYVSWDFADGIVSSSGISDTISHTYTTPGSYIPKLILTDTSSKCSAFSVGADTIKVDTLTPDFTMAPATACQGSTVTFKDASKSLFSPPNTWSWTFGGGGTSTLAANLHVFTSTGTLPVTLNVTNAYGCSGTITKNVVINPPPSPITGKMTICEGGTTPLTDATGGGSWSSANTTVATVDPFGVVSGVFAGTATIVYTSISGCTASAVVKVNPNPKPITGATGVCFGLTTQLSDATPSGFWTSSNTAIAAIGTSGTVTTVATGTTTISYILPTGCLTSVTVNVATSPVTISGNLAVCLGSTSGLSDTVAGGTWTSGNTIIATIGSTSGIVNGLSLGATLVTYSIGTGCSITGTVTVIPVPANITGPTNVCAGSTIALTDGTLGGRWTSTNTSVATVGSGSAIVTGKAGGLDTINYTMSTGCMATLAISVNAATPIIGSSYVCKSYSTTLSDAISPGTWSSSNSAIASIIPSTGVVTGNSVGNVVIKYVNTYGCGVSMIFSVITQPADITGATAGVCAGHSVALSDATPFGTWSSSNTSIAWVDPVTGMATGYVSGTVLISYTVGASGCAIVTNLTVNPNDPIYGPNSMCVGQSVTLMDTVLGGTWSSANSSIASVGITNGITTGVSGGTTTISYTMRTGCVQTYSVTAIPLPPAITGVNHVCPGFTQPLFNSLPGGTWSSSNMLVATIGSTGVVTGNSAGTTTITYVGGGCPITMTFTVNPLPAPITGNNISCFGSSTKLSDASGGGTWASSNGLIATIGGTSGILTGARLGTVTITYTLPTGCYAVKPEIINPPPAGIMGTPRVCEGLTTGFSDFTTGGTWSNDNTLIATIDGLGMATGVKAGTSIITYTAAGCGAYLTLTVNPLPQRIPDTMVCEGAAITLTNVFTGGTWTSGTSLVATAGITSGLITGVTSGVAAITYKLGTGCQTVTAVTVNPAPAPITGTPLVCATLTTQLSDASGSGTWSSGTSSIASVDLAGLVTGNSPGTALISYTIPTGCFNAVAVQVYPFPKIITGSSNLCQYTPLTFSDSVTGGTWSSDNTSIAVIGTSSGIVNGVALGTTTITYTVASSCSTTKAVSVIPLPAVFPITGGGTYCSADTGLHVGLGGSVIGTDYFLYEGTSIPTGPLAGTNNPLDFGLQKVPGTYSVVAVIAATGCSTPMSGTVTVSVVPTVVPSIKITSSGKDTICNGSKVNFAATVVNGGSTPAYAWYVNGTKVSITSAYAYIPADKDIVTVRLLSSAACAEPDTASETRVMQVMLPTTPSAVLSSFPGDTICLGQKISFTIEPSYGGSSPTYSWMVNTARVATGPTFTYVPTKGDIVYAEMKSNYICRTVDSVPSNSVAVSTVEPIVPTATVRATPGENIGHGLFDTLTAYPVNAGASPTYQWLINGYPVAGATNSTFITNEFSTDRSDSVTCEVTSSGICKITTHAWIYITVNFLGVNNATGENDLNIIPNPNKGEFTLKGAIGTATNEDVTLEMTDLLGQVIYKRTIAAPGGAINEKILLGNTVANGMYLLNVRSGSGTKVFHVVLER